MTSISSIVIVESLASNPHEAYPRWLLEVCQLASETLSADFDYGLLGLIVTAPQWAALPGNSVTDPATGVITVAPVPNPQAPPALANNAAAGASTVHRELVESARRFRVGKATLAKAILDSLGTQIRRSITSRVHNIIILTIPEIMAEMDVRFGIFSATDVAAYTSMLLTPLTSGDKCDFESFATSFQDNLAVLERANQPVSAYEKMAKFEIATSSQTNIAHAIQSYRDHQPILQMQSLDNMIPYITARLSNLPTAALGYASSAIVRQNKFRTGGRGGGRGGRGGRLHDQPQFYCYHHGTNSSHNGSTCKFMRSSPIHTDAMIAALSGSTGGKA